MSERGFELLAVGRCGVDLYPLDHGVPLPQVSTFQKFLGGTAANVAVAAARHGVRAALVTKTGADPFGDFVRSEAQRLGIDPRYIGALAEPGPPTPVTFCEIFPPDDFPLYFYRYPIAPDLLLSSSDLDPAAVAAAEVFWLTATGLSAQPSASTHLAALEARARRRHTVLDLDYRPMFWPDEQTASRQVAGVLDRVTVAVGNTMECRIAVGETDPHRAADALLDRGIELAVVKRGPDGVLAATRDERIEVPPYPVRVINGLGAGDAFGGALVHGLLQGWDLDKLIRFANVAGAIVAGRLECSTAMPTTIEVEQALSQGLPS